MSKYGPGSAFLLVGGKNLSGDVFTLTERVEGLLDQSNGLGKTMEEHLPNGLARAILEATGGIYDDRVIGMLDALQTAGAAGTLQILSYGMAGYAVGADVTLLDGMLVAAWKRIAARDGLTKAEAEYRLTGNHRRGVVVHGLTAETADPWDSKSTPVDQALAPRLPSTAITSSSVANPSVITTPVAHGLSTGEVVLISGHSGSTPTINGGNGYAVTVTGTFTFTIPVNVTVGGTGGTFVKVSTNGAELQLHVPVLALGGFTNVLLTPVHSDDASTWVTLGSAFAAVTLAGTSERKTVAGQVKRYVAVTGDFVGAGSAQSITPYVAVSR